MDSLQDELKQINGAIAHILKGGQSYTINSGGGQRQVTYADYNALVKRKDELEDKIDSSSRSFGQRITAGW